jgi:hypothetical protein
MTQNLPHKIFGVKKSHLRVQILTFASSHHASENAVTGASQGGTRQET